MMSIRLFTPQEIALQIAQRAQMKRLALNYSQKFLSERSGVSFGVIKKFERTGQISLVSLLKLALVLDAQEEFLSLFQAKPLERWASLDLLLQHKSRKRGRL